MSDKVKYINCYSDLQKVSMALYSNSGGNSHKVFLQHALELLTELGSDKKSKLDKLIKLEDLDSKKRADKVLTLGLQTKPAFNH